MPDMNIAWTHCRNICSLVTTPTRGWGKQNLPASGEITIGDDIERIRFLKNTEYSHLSETADAGKNSLKIWYEMSGVCSRIDSAYGTHFLTELHNIQSEEVMGSQTKRKLAACKGKYISFCLAF